MFIVSIFSFLFALSMMSEVVSYVDAAGQQHYVSGIAAVPESYRNQVKGLDEKVRINRMEYPKSDNSYGAEGKKEVEIFVASWCGYCRKLEQYLKSKSIPYKRYDVEHDSFGISQYQKFGAGGVPIVRIGGKVIRGFDVPAIETALGN